MAADAAVLVATVRAVKYHGGVERENLGRENVQAVTDGFANVRRHLRNIREQYGLRAVIALNHFSQDTEAEVRQMKSLCEAEGVEMIVCRHWAEGGAGAEVLAEQVVALCEGDKTMTFLYDDETPLKEKVDTVAQKNLRRLGHQRLAAS